MDNVSILYLCGIYNLLFAIFHLFFWKIFKWGKDLKRNTLTNRAIIQILNIRLIYIFLLMAFLYIVYPNDLLETEIGIVLQIGFLGFWIGRTIEQFIFLGVQSTLVNVLTLIFVIGIIIHSLPLLM